MTIPTDLTQRLESSNVTVTRSKSAKQQQQMSRRPWRNTRAGGRTERMWQVEASQGGSAANRGSKGSDITAWDQFPKKTGNVSF